MPFIIQRPVNTDALRILNVCRSVVSKLQLKLCQESKMSFYWFLCKRLKGKNTAHFVRGKICLFFPQVTSNTGANTRQCGGVWKAYNSYLQHADHLRFSHSLCFAYVFLSSVSKECCSNKEPYIKHFHSHINIQVWCCRFIVMSWWDNLTACLLCCRNLCSRVFEKKKRL